MFDMRIFQKRGWWQLEIARNKSRSLKTKDEAVARRRLKEAVKAQLEGKLVELERIKRISIKDFQDKYIASREGDVSPETIKKDNATFRALADTFGSDKPIQTIDYDEFKKLLKIRNPKIKNVTINGYLRQAKAALTYAIDKGYLTKKPKIKMLKTADELPRLLMPDQIKTLLEKADSDFRRYLTFMIWTGCRRKEGLNLEWQNVNLDKGYCKVTGKGSKERIVPLMPPVIEALEPVKKDIGKVFIQYHRDTISKMFHSLAASCEITARLHDLRHSAVTYMLKSGIKIEVVKEIVGHAQLSTTMIYTHVLDELKQQEMRKMKIE